MKISFVVLMISFLTLYFDFPCEGTQISGVVIDNDSGEKIFGANIREGSIKNGAETNEEGRFTINVSDVKNDLIISFIGYEDYVLKIEPGKVYYEVRLVESAQVLESVVVTAYKVPLIKIDNAASGSFVSSPVVLPAKSINGKICGINSGTNNKSKDSHDYLKQDKGNTSEYYKAFQDNPFVTTNENSTTTMSIDVDRASYANIRRFINNESLPPVDAVRLEEMINYFEYNWQAPSEYAKEPFAIHQSIVDCPWNKEHKVLTIALKAKEINKSKTPPSNLVFLIDVSGSMSDDDKLPLLKKSFKLLTQQLTEKDKVSIVVYAGAAGTVLDGVKGNDKSAIYEALDRLQAGGSTAGADGILQAYKLAKKHFTIDGNNRVILATDGDFNVGISSDEDLIKLIENERKGNVYLSVLGFGQGNYQDGKMQQLADKGNGNHFYIDNLAEANKCLVKEFGGTLFTIAKDVKIQIDFDKSVVASYRVLGYENRQLANEYFDDDAKDAGEIGCGHTVTVMYEIEFKPHMSNKVLGKIKYRYKPLNSKASIKNEISILSNGTPYLFANNNVKWALSVVEFGLLLRNSPYKENANYEQLISRTKNLVGNDKDKKECLDLMETAQLFYENLSARD